MLCRSVRSAGSVVAECAGPLGSLLASDFRFPLLAGATIDFVVVVAAHRWTLVRR